MTDKDGADVDPRYDPAFQRGFEGTVATGPHGQSTLRRTAAVNPAPARQVPQHIAELPPTPVEPVVTTPQLALAPDAPATATGQTDVPPRSIASSRDLVRNPFVLALAVLGALLVVGGAVWAYEGFATIVKNGGTRNEVEFWAAQTMSFGAPLAIVMGLAIAAVLLVLFGRTWQRK